MNELKERAEVIIEQWSEYQQRIGDRRSHDRGTPDRRQPQAVQFAQLLLMQLQSEKYLRRD